MDEWIHYQKLVVNELSRLNSSVHEINEKLNTQHTAIEVLKVRSTLYGAVGGVAGGVLTVLGVFLTNWIKTNS